MEDSGNNNNKQQDGDDGGTSRRVTIGASNNNRRTSLGFDAIGEALGRRLSGFGDLDGMGRRGSMDSTTAVLDAAIMDLTRRRLSMAMGGMPQDGGMGGMNDPLSMGGMGGMNPMGGMMGGMGGGMIGMSAMNTGNSASSAVNSINARQQQLQEQQRELERRQKELELQRQQLLSAMEERRRVMQQMQSKMQGSDHGGASPAALAQRNSLLGSLGGGFGGGRSSLLGSFGGGATPGGSAGQQAGGGGNAGPEWYVCKICNSKAFSNREEAFAHESICIQNSFGANFRRNSGMHDARRGSLDLLGALAGATPTAATTNRFFKDSLGSMMDNSTNEAQMSKSLTMSSGPFAMMDTPLPLAMGPDKDWLTPLHCFVRRHCVEVFTATEDDVATPSKGKRKPIHVGQVGIRCPHCHTNDALGSRERGSVYYPTTISSIYNATMNLLQRHLHNCRAVPQDIMRRYEVLKADDARSGTSKKYWVESALSLGLVDTPSGIRFSALTPPPLPTLTSQQKSSGNYSASRGSDDDFFNSSSNALTTFSQRGNQEGRHEDATKEDMDKSTESSKAGKPAEGSIAAVAAAAKEGTEENIPDTEQSLASSAPLVTPEDEPYATAFSYHLLSQMQPCVFTEADRLGKRKGLPPGFAGLACRHCFGGYGSGRFFPSSIKTLSDTSKTLNVLHNHMMRCRKCPAEVRETLDKLRKFHDEQRAKMKFGSQKAFFARIWDRLHYKDPNINSKRKFQHPRKPDTSGAASASNSGNLSAAAAAHFQQHMGGGFPGGFSGLSGFPGGFPGGMPGGFGGGMYDSLAMQYAAGDMLESNKRRKLQEMANSQSSV